MACRICVNRGEGNGAAGERATWTKAQRVRPSAKANQSAEVICPTAAISFCDNSLISRERQRGVWNSASRDMPTFSLSLNLWIADGLLGLSARRNNRALLRPDRTCLRGSSLSSVVSRLPPASLDRYPRGVTGHVALPRGSIQPAIFSYVSVSRGRLLSASNDSFVFVMRADPKPVCGVAMNVGERPITRVTDSDRPNFPHLFEMP